MKKKVLLTFALALMLVCVFAFSAFAVDSVHAGKVDLNATVTLDDGTVCNLFDSEGNALIWFKNGSELQSIRADDERVKYKATYQFNVGNSQVGYYTAYEVSDMWIALDSGNINKGNIVVLNLMDDDVIINEATNNAYLNHPVNGLKTIAWANKVLEYAFLRLDTAAIQQQAFNGCTKLKYVNLEDLTELRQLGGSQTFAGSTSLFKGEVLDLTRTKLVSFAGDGTFNEVPFAGIKLPNTLANFSSWALQKTGLVEFTVPEKIKTLNGSLFKGCAKLTTLYLSSSVTSISDRALGYENGYAAIPLEKVFYVGTLEQLEALIANVSGNNVYFTEALGENNSNVISYADYLALEDKSGKYVVYDYSYCEAYREGIHTKNEALSNNCVLTCSVCEAVIVKHVDAEMESVVVEYADLMKEGTKTTTCGNTGCTLCVEETLKPIFHWVGYSAKTFGDLKGFGQQYVINQKELGDYKAYVESQGDIFSYGVVAAGASSAGKPLEIVDGVVTDKAGAESICFNQIKYDAFFMNITGIDDANLDANLVCCAYVQLGEEIVYLDDNQAKDTAGFLTYNIVAGLPETKEEIA